MSNFALTADQEADVLNFDPWGERDATYRVLDARFGVVRKDHACDICFGPIKAGERVWLRREVDDGKAGTFRFCPECCWCIAHRHDDIDDDRDGYDRMYDRWEIGRANAEKQRAAAPGPAAERGEGR